MVARNEANARTIGQINSLIRTERPIFSNEQLQSSRNGLTAALCDEARSLYFQAVGSTEEDISDKENKFLSYLLTMQRWKTTDIPEQFMKGFNENLLTHVVGLLELSNSEVLNPLYDSGQINKKDLQLMILVHDIDELVLTQDPPAVGQQRENHIGQVLKRFVMPNIAESALSRIHPEVQQDFRKLYERTKNLADPEAWLLKFLDRKNGWDTGVLNIFNREEGIAFVDNNQEQNELQQLNNTFIASMTNYLVTYYIARDIFNKFCIPLDALDSFLQESISIGIEKGYEQELRFARRSSIGKLRRKRQQLNGTH